MQKLNFVNWRARRRKVRMLILMLVRSGTLTAARCDGILWRNAPRRPRPDGLTMRAPGRALAATNQF